MEKIGDEDRSEKKRGDGIIINYSYCRGKDSVFRLCDFSGGYYTVISCVMITIFGLRHGGFRKR